MLPGPYFIPSHFFLQISHTKNADTHFCHQVDPTLNSKVHLGREFLDDSERFSHFNDHFFWYKIMIFAIFL